MYRRHLQLLTAPAHPEADPATSHAGGGDPAADAAAKAAADQAAADKAAADKAAADKAAADTAAKAAADKAAADKAAADKAAADKAAADKAATAPETYELKTPAGLDDEDLARITAIAKEHGWTNDQAQAALEEYGASMTRQRDAFRAELVKHAEIGGAHQAAAQERALRALDHFLPKDSPEGKALRSLMDKGGYGEWVPFRLLLARIGKAMGEDTGLSSALKGGAGGADEPQPTKNVLFKTSSPGARQ